MVKAFEKKSRISEGCRVDAACCLMFWLISAAQQADKKFQLKCSSTREALLQVYKDATEPKLASAPVIEACLKSITEG